MSDQHIEQLRQLVDRGLAQHPPHPCHARVVLHLEHRTAHLVLRTQCLQPRLRVRVHAAKLDEGERTSAQATTALHKEDRSGGVELDRQCHKQE